ncbi:MAG: twin-arginine translocase TatA/TatE family subunit [Methanosarcinaceae archaeon]|nr:twin-arginine translocase TatA/TatE family subunit [Methanosarcinaceae archaeon]MDD4331363.1 twin-arginine translocase TatA/TatE family subunit [Methanosarcinaceae archaeon]MDD4750010.1 twin-arginine translocase TatA/TatE family subunit [Methanosarcinaceae archaeon]
MIGSSELIAILIAAVFLFGPQKLPELARSLGSAFGEFKKAQRAAELGLTDFDAYARSKPGEDGNNEKEREDAGAELRSVLESGPSISENTLSERELKKREKNCRK